MGQSHGRMLYTKLVVLFDGCTHGFTPPAHPQKTTLGTADAGKRLALNATWLFCTSVTLVEAAGSSVHLDVNRSGPGRGVPPSLSLTTDMWRMFDQATNKVQGFVATMSNRGDWESILCERVVHTVASALVLLTLVDPNLEPKDMDPSLAVHMRRHAIEAARSRLQGAVRRELVRAKAEAALYERLSDSILHSDPSTFLPTSLDVWGQARSMVSAATKYATRQSAAASLRSIGSR
ncbi:MAG: hypothetical protein WDW38_006566 [Sanguina aurantia]